jgi:diguanylate cyclase (GGDEF)-like protein
MGGARPTTAEARETRATFRNVLAIREFRALYIAQNLSVAGDQLARIAVGVLVFDRTGSPTLTGLSYAVSYLPWLLVGPVLSGYADRKPRREVMILCDALRLIVVLVMALPGLRSGELIALVALVACGEAPFVSARGAMIPDILGEGDLYAAGSTLSNATGQMAVVIGYATGGLLVASVGTHTALLVDAATFLLSGLTAVRFVERRPAANATPAHWRRDLAEGARVVFTNNRLRWLVATTWLVLGVVVSTEAAAIPYASAHSRGAATAGLLIASLPLGIIVGTLLMRRFLAATTSEHLMLPLALLAPAILSLTAFNPAAWIAATIWFSAGTCAAVTVTANRVFVVSVPRAVRGRAFGIAVTGIAAAQGSYSLLTGIAAHEAGPAHAIADLSLLTFVILASVSIISPGYRSEPTVPTGIPTETPTIEGRHLTIKEPVAHPARRVWVLDVCLTLVALALVTTLRGDRAHDPIHLPIWWLGIVFLIGQAYPLNFRIRKRSFQVVLETVPLVLGLLFIPPLELVAIRVGVMAVVFALIHRVSRMKWLFNVSATGICTLMASAVFRHVAPASTGAHPGAWIGTFAAVVTSEVLAGALVLAAMALSGTSSQAGETFRVIGFGIAASVMMTFLALFTAAALDYDVSTSWAISVFVLLVIASSQTYHRLAERAAALDRLYVVARELGHIAAEPSDLAPALIQLRQVIRASSLELAVATASERDFVTVVAVMEGDEGDDRLTVEERPIAGGIPALLAEAPRNRHWGWLIRPVKASRRSIDRISAPVGSPDREIGVLSAVNGPGPSAGFERSDLRLLEAAADQLAAALEKGRLVDSLRRAATLDTLTGLANLDSLRSFLDTSLEGAAGGVLILLNLDRFREVNDMLGHAAGDKVLAEVARRLQSAPTQGALFARVGGDQFAIAIPGAAGSEVARLAGMAVKSRVDGSLRLAEVSADVRVTVGIARAPDHGSDAATLLRRAEMAMAAAKGSTSGIGEWEPDYERDGSRRLQLLTGLRAALGDGSLRVEYQPKLRLGSGEVTGFEALVRWTHPELGPVSPAEFVPIAEATGLVSALTSTVLRQALTTCRSWHDAGRPVGVAVNISARSLADNVLVGQVAAMLTASGVEPQWLTLEITESSVMADHSRSLEVLRELRMLGVRLSIDDFGTGYSSLHQLRGLPVHEVKIDRSFVDTVDSDEADRAVIHAVVELCESLGLVTVAEGVEKASQAYALETLGVRQVQGYFHGRPMDEQTAMTWLLHRRTADVRTTAVETRMG